MTPARGEGRIYVGGFSEITLIVLLACLLASFYAGCRIQKNADTKSVMTAKQEVTDVTKDYGQCKNNELILQQQIKDQNAAILKWQDAAKTSDTRAKYLKELSIKQVALYQKQAQDILNKPLPKDCEEAVRASALRRIGLRP